MSDPTARARAWCRSRLLSARDFVTGAVRGPGDARDGMLLLLKGAAAATAAWCLSSWLLPSNVTAFAPFTALLALQSTVYRSLWDSAQYLGAMAIGTAVAAGFGSTAGVHVWSLLVLVFTALLVARLDLLGQQATQVPVVALFAFVGGGGRIDYIGHLVGSATIGVCCGLVAHLAIAPSPHTDTAQQRVEDLAARARSMLRTLARTAEGRSTDEGAWEDWPRRCEELAAQAKHARAVLDREHENTKLNPRRRWSSAEEALQRCHETISMVERTGTHIRSIARALEYEPEASASSSGPSRTPRASVSADFLPSYAQLLHGTAAALDCLGPPQGPEDPDRLRACLDEAARRYEEVATMARNGPLDHPGEWPVHGTALLEAARILDEIEGTFSRTAETPE